MPYISSADNHWLEHFRDLLLWLSGWSWYEVAILSVLDQDLLATLRWFVDASLTTLDRVSDESSCLESLSLANEAFVFLNFGSFVLVTQSGMLSPSLLSFKHLYQGLLERLLGFAGQLPLFPFLLFPEELLRRGVRSRVTKNSPVALSTLWPKPPTEITVVKISYINLN